MSSGHEGSYATTIQTSYQPLSSDDRANAVGERQRLITRNLYEVINAELKSKQSLEASPDDEFVSTTQQDYFKGMVVCSSSKVKHDNILLTTEQIEDKSEVVSILIDDLEFPIMLFILINRPVN